MLLEYFYKELIVLCIVIFFLIRYLSKQSKKKSLVIDEKEEEVEYVAEIRQDISKEKLVGIFLIVAALIVLVLAMYYLMPMLLDYILPKDN